MKRLAGLSSSFASLARSAYDVHRRWIPGTCISLSGIDFCLSFAEQQYSCIIIQQRGIIDYLIARLLPEPAWIPLVEDHQQMLGEAGLGGFAATHNFLLPDAKAHHWRNSTYPPLNPPLCPALDSASQEETGPKGHVFTQ